MFQEQRSGDATGERALARVAQIRNGTFDQLVLRLV
jgi:hypothetical protein